ncbi:CocE/NonD family hydrolase [Occallatibacter riparius]|uniref:CocE/NonD family hydrolase n=1 Tax=Occallatibacter riparius TaxID=1002689 RepID=A0A9J7BM17_9BACT|nr:CocE/NonD family hydrolase [Occallatibacter riparius]UWZ81950.1 CocE/NonD family hydrolase [Occallatibacter riparius]
MFNSLHRWVGAFALILLAVVCVPAQETKVSGDDFIKSHYTKYEFRIPMRDGKRLFTAVYVPKTSAFPADPGPYPFLMDRTPYSVAPYGEDKYPAHLGPSDEFEKGGYIFVYQDVRGRYMSEGEFIEMRPHIDDKKSPQDVDDSSDTYDTIEFLLKNVDHNNGKVGIWGISYPGFYTSASIIDSHPALVAASPQAPMTDLFKGDDAYHGGAFMLSANFGFYAFFKPQSQPQTPHQSVPFDFGTPDTYRFYLNAGNLANLEAQYLKGSNWLFNDQMNHDTYDSYWQARDLSRHMKNVKCAVLVVGGWYDAEDLSGPYRTFNAISKMNPETPTTLVEGPWVHGGWARGEGSHLGDIQFNAKTSEYFHASVQFPFFEHYLKGKSAGAQPKAVVFETGTNVWRHFEEWPPKEAKAKTFYFHAGGKLSFDAPADAKGVDEYVSDPNHPVPFVGYTTDTVPQRYMVDDQRFSSYRPDVLVYQTDPLTEDVTIAGPISPKLKIASSGTDSDFVVKLIDVYPEDYGDAEGRPNKRVTDEPPLRMGGYQELLRGEPMRAKFRNSWEKPEPLTPGKQTEVDFTMPDLFHTFRRGHRIMVQVQSSWFPLTDRNPQTFTDIPHAKPEDFKKATEQVFREKDAASGVEVMVMPAR